MYLGIFATAGTAGADVETHSGTQWESTGWTQVSFYRGDGPDGYEDECPKWAWAEILLRANYSESPRSGSEPNRSSKS